MAERPAIVMVMGASVDGRITTGPGRNVQEWTRDGMDGGAHKVLAQLIRTLGGDGMVSGSESVRIWGAHPVEMPGKDEAPPEMTQPYIVIDGHGRIDWAYTDGLIVVTRATVALAYQEQLALKHIDTIWAGEGDHVDLVEALAILHRRGFRRLLLNGGGRLNGACLRAGLVDEVVVVWSPVLVGGSTTPTLYDAPDLLGPDGVVRLSLRESGSEGDVLYARYAVIKATG
jgi:riboflavin biosynthesis pyrimidine reductase